MDPFSLPRLDWKDYLKHPAVKAAHGDLAMLTKRQVLLHSLSLIPETPQSCYTAWSNAIHIFIEEDSDRVIHSLVHELLHGILVEEGYCRIAAKLPRKFHGMFSNELQHPEIFRRMESTYRLDMRVYWRFWEREIEGYIGDMLDHLAKEPREAPRQMMRLFSFFFFQNITRSHLEEYGRYHLDIFKAAEAAYEDTKGIGFADVVSHRRSFGILKDHWARFYEAHVSSGPGETTAQDIREGTLIPLGDWEKKRPAEEIMELFHREGYRPV